MEATQIEEWRAIAGFEGYYEVSNLGNVRSLTRVLRPSYRPMTLEGKPLKPRPMRSGHLQVNLRRNNTSRNHLVHRLVAIAFLGQPLPGQEVRHLNGEPTDNRLQNLAWGTRSENMYDRRAHGVDHEVNKTHCPRGHLLIEPNNRAIERRNGNRSCLACSRAGAYMRRHGLPKSALQKVSDSYYERIMVQELAS